MSRPGRAAHPGALVLSLDFELHWGVRDHVSLSSRYVANLRGARGAVRELLATFSSYDVACTWATVGFLFARDRAELTALHPARRPSYANARLDPYGEPVGDDERADPLHYAASLVEQIREARRQEIGTHTYSHYYCLEPGQDAETFAADIRSPSRRGRGDRAGSFSSARRAARRTSSTTPWRPASRTWSSSRSRPCRAPKSCGVGSGDWGRCG